MAAGRPLAIETPEELLELFNEYEEEIKSNPKLVQDYVGKDATMVYREKERAITIQGFSTWLFKRGIINDVRHYFTNTNGAYDKFLAVATYIRGAIDADHIDGGMAGIYNSNLTARLTGLVDKKEVENNGTINITTPQDAEGLGE